MSTWAKKRQSHQESDSTSARPAALSSACAAQASERVPRAKPHFCSAPRSPREGARRRLTHRCRLAWRDDPARLEYVPPHVSLDLIASNHDRMRGKVEKKERVAADQASRSSRRGSSSSSAVPCGTSSLSTDKHAITFVSPSKSRRPGSQHCDVSRPQTLLRGLVEVEANLRDRGSREAKRRG